MAILSELQSLSVVTGIVSRVNAPGSLLQRIFGMEIGNPNVRQVSGRAYSWDIFDHTRKIAIGRAPGTGPASRSANPVGRVTGTFPRSYEKITLDYELLHNIRTIGQDAGQRDRMGIAYLERQSMFLKEVAINFREALCLGLTRGTLDFKISGDDWIPVLSGGHVTIDWRIPAGNKSAAIPGLDPLGTGNIIDAAWSNAATDIPLHLDKINQAFQQLVGSPLGAVLTDSTVWNHVLNNTAVRNQAGSVNTAYEMYTMDTITGPDGRKLGLQRGRLKARPWLDWWILDQGLEIDGTFTRYYDGTRANFMIDPDPNWIRMIEGSEPVKTAPWNPAQEGFGLVSWMKEWDEPARVEQHCLQNAVPELNIPKAIMSAKVA